MRGSVNYDGTSLEPYDFTAQKSYRYVIAEHAATTVPYDLYIAGTQVTSANAADVLDDGKVSYDAETKTLTLNGVSLTSGGSDSQVWGDESDADRVYAPIFSNIQGLTIQVTGENTLTSAGDPGQEPGLGQGGSLSCGIFSLQDLTFTGSGTLNAVGGAARITHGIFSLGDLTVGDTFTGTLSATGGAAKSSSYGILGEKNITITGSGTVTAAGGSATATNGARSVGIYCYDYDTGVLTIGGSSKVTATAGKAESGQSYGIYAHAVNAGGTATVNAVGGKAVQSSSGITTLSHGIDAFTLTISDSAEVTATGGEVVGGETSYGVKLSQKAMISGGSLTAVGSGGDSCEYSRGLATPANSGYGLYITGGTVSLMGGPTKDGGYGFGFAGGDLSLTGGSLTARTEAANGSAIRTYGTYKVTVEPVMASTAANGTGAVTYVAADNDTYKWFQAPFDDQESPTDPTQVATPVLPESTVFNDSMTITITCETEGAAIYYTTGGAITLYEGAFNITETTTVEAYATKD
ncbi:MAG: chitobiase/beta-hexosaminidase C-terminal domain-containing protein, partial [Oscillospiraceae bacterium]|nr:chitobiase/beta-hexosaminidase C-terminal domain-containing protein [Oscillospiraceae bacterium]